jgi:hypothetical protein
VRPPRLGRGALVVAALGAIVWLLAAVVRRGPDPAVLGATRAARLATLDRALPPGTSRDSVRRFLHARRLDLSQQPGGALLVVLPGGRTAGGAVLPPERLVFAFDANGRLTARCDQARRCAGAPDDPGRERRTGGA